MTKKRRSPRRNRKRRQHSSVQEERRAEVITVVWMLTVLTTTLANIVALVGWLGIYLSSEPEALPVGVRLLPRWMLFVAAVTGLVCLLLIAPTKRLRVQPPPDPIVRFAIVVSILPWLVFVIILVQS